MAPRVGLDAGLEAARYLARTRDPDPQHVFQVTRLSLMLFDAAAALHGLGPAERRLLEAAALLHDIGHAVEEASHHKHTLAYVVNLELPGFTRSDLRTVACVARYHRKAHPDPQHQVFRDLDSTQRAVVGRLAALLRVADGLDRAHLCTAQALWMEQIGSRVRLIVRQRRPSQVDLWGADRKKGLFEDVYGVTLEVLAEDTEGAA